MAPRKPREGSLLRISLGDGTAAYARVLSHSQVAIYSYRDSQSQKAPPAVYDAPLLWKISVMRRALVSGRWPVVDHRALEVELAQPVNYFIHDELSGTYSIYRSSDGFTRACSFDECKSLEAAAVWDPEHVEDRIRDHFAGIPNVWAEQLTARAAPTDSRVPGKRRRTLKR